MSDDVDDEEVEAEPEELDSDEDFPGDDEALLEDDDVVVVGDDDDAIVVEDEEEETPAPARKSKAESESEEEEEDDEEEGEDVEASLDVILKEKLVVEDEPEDDEEDGTPDTDDRGDSTRKVAPRRPDEFVCQSCFLVKHPSQLADKKNMYCNDCV